MRGNTTYLLLIAIALTGCSTMSRDECRMADWQTIGYEDGVSGRNAAYIGERRKACAKHGVAPNQMAYDTGYSRGILIYCSFDRGRQAALNGFVSYEVCPSQSEYRRGYADGLESFCSYQSGYDYGLAGGSYQRTCPARLEDTFLQGYDAGGYIRVLQNQLADLQAQLQKLDIRRDDNKQQQKELKQKLILDSQLDSQQRAQILLDIDTLHDESNEVKKQKKEVLTQIRRVQAQLKGMGVDI